MVMHSNETFARECASATNFHIQNTGGCDGKIAGLYDFEETLGSGHFAVVKLARHVFTGEKVAVKVVDKTKLDEVSKSHLFQEVRCMKLVQHPNVVRLYEVIDTQTKLYLILELGDGGDLYDYIMKHESGLSEELARKYFRQILKAIAYCHQLHVVHRDLKPENVVFFEKLGVVKLTDFGFSNKFLPGQKLQTFCGSLAYSAPEILLGDSYDAPAVDIWSLGVILYMLVCGQAPFEKANDSETLTMIMDCKYIVPSQISQNCRKLIASMLVRDPKKRATIEQISGDPWLTENSGDCKEYLPLISQEEISEEDTAFIMQKMINGNIASKDIILQSLEKNKYDHITATYYLLAEIRLRKRREDRVGKEKSKFNSKNAPLDIAQSKLLKPNYTNKMANPNNSSSHTILTPKNDKTEKRNRKFSIVREEDEEESSLENSATSNSMKVSIRRRESPSEGRQNRTPQKQSNIEDSTTIRGCSNSDVIGDNPSNLSLEPTLLAMHALDIGKFKSFSTIKQSTALTHRRSKLSKIRTPSCSSSEASDDDTKSRSKKKINKLVGDTPIRLRMHRRDSHDDSSDSQDQAFSSTASHSHSKNIVSSNVRNVNERQTQGQQKPNTNSDERKAPLYNHRNKKSQIKYAINKNSQTKMEICYKNEKQFLDRIAEVQEFEQRRRFLKTTSWFDFEHSQTKGGSLEDFENISSEFDLNHNNLNKEEMVWQKTGLNYLDVLENNITLDTRLIKTFNSIGTKSCDRIKKLRNSDIHFPVISFSYQM